MKFKELFECAKNVRVDGVGRTKEFSWRGWRLHIYNTGCQINVIDEDDLAVAAITNNHDGSYKVYRASRPGYVEYSNGVEYSDDDSIDESYASPYAAMIEEIIVANNVAV